MARRAFLLVALVPALALLQVSAADAEITGPCTATMNGTDVNQIDTPQTALRVDHRDTVTVAAASSAEITGHRVQLEFLGIGWTADERPDEGTSWSGTVNVADYATYGVGLYKVIGVSKGAGACTGVAYIEIVGKSPFTTVAGIGAVALGLTGLGLGLASVIAATKGPGRKGLGTGIAAGVLLAASALVLAQQFGLVYPTPLVGALALAAGIGLGVAAPTGVHAMAGGSAGAAIGAPPPPPPPPPPPAPAPA